MKRWSWVLVLLVLAGMLAAPAYADERLKLTGYIDNHINWMKNPSDTDSDLTQNGEQRFFGRSRARMFFNIMATENSKAVVAFEFDQGWGEGTDNVSSSDDCHGGAPNCGFDLGIDNNVFELKQLYVDFKIPGWPVRMQIGGPRFFSNVLSGKDCLLLCADAGGINMFIDLVPEAKLVLYFINVQEEGDRRTFDWTLGEDYIMGTRLETEFVKGMQVHLLGLFMHEVGPRSDTQRRRIFGSNNPNFRESDLFWLGVDASLRFGNLTVAPTFIYSGGKLKWHGGQDSDVKAFLVDLAASYKTGPWTIHGHFFYTPGNKASDNLTNGSGEDINFYYLIFPDGVNDAVHWFELLGYNIDTTSGGRFPSTSRGLDDNGSFDQFGLIHGAIRIDYKAMKQLTLSGSLGIFSAAEDVGRPARLGGPTPAAGFDNFNYRNKDKYLGTEFDVWLSYQIFPKATVDVWFAYAFTGDAYDLENGTTGQVRSAKDIVGMGSRIIYRY
jgi:hypothetical protein